jgi:prevent-host-death family protein
VTRIAKSPARRTDPSRRRRAKDPRPDHWRLQEAKARFSELVRRVKTDGPQLVTVHGREEVVVVSVDEFHRLKGRPTGQALVDALRESPLRHVDLERRRERSPVRDVDL